MLMGRGECLRRRGSEESVRARGTPAIGEPSVCVCGEGRYKCSSNFNLKYVIDQMANHTLEAHTLEAQVAKTHKPYQISLCFSLLFLNWIFQTASGIQ